MRVSEEYGDVVGRTQGVGVLVGTAGVEYQCGWDGGGERGGGRAGSEQVVMHDEL